MDDREQRGLAHAALYRIEQQDGKWIVPYCTCPDHRDRAIKCKHMFAVEFVQTRQREPDGTETVTRTFKVTEKHTT